MNFIPREKERDDYAFTSLPPSCSYKQHQPGAHIEHTFFFSLKLSFFIFISFHHPTDQKFMRERELRQVADVARME
jgi:hypothetical protein